MLAYLLVFLTLVISSREVYKEASIRSVKLEKAKRCLELRRDPEECRSQLEGIVNVRSEQGFQMISRWLEVGSQF